MRQHAVSRSLSLPRMLGGAVRGLAIANGTITALLCYATYTGGFWTVAGFFCLACVSTCSCAGSPPVTHGGTSC